MGDKSAECWWEPDDYGGYNAVAGRSALLRLEPSARGGGAFWWVACFRDGNEQGESPSIPEAKRAAIEAARRVLRESLGMLDALEDGSR